MTSRKFHTIINNTFNSNLILYSLFFFFLLYTQDILLLKINKNFIVRSELLNSKTNNKNKISNLKNTLKLNLVENCEELLTCDACLRNSDRCGWCYSDGLCKSGNKIGASSSFNFCSFEDWETQKCEVRKCNTYKNQLSCITDENCFWCENIKSIEDQHNNNNYVSGLCEDNENKFSKRCKNIYDINNYFKNPKFYRGKNSNDMLSEELKQLSTLEMYNPINNKHGKNKNSKEDSTIETILTNINHDKTNNTDKKFSNYEKFLNNLRNFMKSNSIKKLPIYNSISNPSGIFDFQNNFFKKNIVLQTTKNSKYPNSYKETNTLKNMNFTISDLLSKHSKSEITEISKKIAVEQLKGMFKFYNNDPIIKKLEKTFNLKEYKILEKIASEKWVEFLENKKIKLNEVRIIIGYYKDDTDSADEVKKNFEKHQKLSLLYTLKINSDKIDTLGKFKTVNWNKIQGSSLGFRAYFNSILLILQKIRFVGKGSFFESLPVWNEEGIKSLMCSNRKSLSKLDINNFVARKVNKGENDYYVAYKSDFVVLPSEDNMIVNYVMEFPFVNNLKIFRETFNPNFPNEVIFKNILNHNLKVDIPHSSTFDENSLQQKYLLIYKLSSNYIEKNTFIKLSIKNKETGEKIDEIASSHYVHLPFYSEYKNIFGLSALSLQKGDFEINAIFKYFLQEFNLEKINNSENKKEFYIYNNTKTIHNITSFNNNLKKQFEVDKKKVEGNSNITNESLKKNETFKTSKIKKNFQNMVQENIPEISEAQEHIVKVPTSEDKIKHKHKKKHKKYKNKTKLFFRNDGDFEEEFENYYDRKTGEKSNDTRNTENQNFSKNNEDVNQSIFVIKDSDKLDTEKLDKQFLINKIKELSIKLEIAEKEINYSKVKENNKSYLISKKNSSDYIFKDQSFLQDFEKNTTLILNRSLNHDEKKNLIIVEEKYQDEFQKQRLADDENLNEANKTKSKKKKKHKKNKLKKGNNSTNGVHQSLVNSNVLTYTSNETINKHKNNSTGKSNVSKDFNKGHNNSSNLHTTKSKGNKNKKNSKKKKDYPKVKKDVIEKMNKDIKKNNNKNISKNNLNFFSEIDDKNKDILKDLKHVLKNSKKEESQHKKFDFFELNLIQLPISTMIFNKIYKNILYFQSNGEFNEIPTLYFNLKLNKEKNVLIFINMILTLDYVADFDFRLHINGRDERNSAIISKSKHIINENSINVKKFPAGDYKFEILYNTNKQGAVNLALNEWDVFSLTVVAFDI